MARLGWDRFDSQDDGYYVEPLSLREDSDSGALTHLSRRQEQALVVAFLRRIAVDEHQFDHSGHLITALAERIEKGDHYRVATQEPSDAYYAANLRNA